MAEIQTTNTGKNKSSFSSSRKRLSTKVDLTPMVDLGFLLITFFVFTTSMSLPTAMDLTETHAGSPINVRQSGSMTILLGKDHRLFYYYGILNESAAAKQLVEADFKTFRSLVVQKKKTTNADDLMFIIKPSGSSRLGDSINLLDEMIICAIPGGHFAEIDITPVETRALDLLEK